MSKSKIFLLLCLSFILGVLAASFYHFSWFSLGLALLISIILIASWWRVSQVRIVGFCLLFFVLGMIRLIISVPADSDFSYLKFYNEQKLSFRGLVVVEPDIRDDNIKLTIRAKEKRKDSSRWGSVKGKVLVTVPRFPEYEYGDYLEINCQLKTPAEFDDFSYKDYLAKDNIYSVCYNPEIKHLESNRGNFILTYVYKLKDKSKHVLEKILTEPHQSFLAGMILGVKRGIPEELIEAFNKTGTSHIIVISGLHITIVAGLLMYLAQGFLGLSRKYSFWFAVLGILFFILLTGVRPSSIRAGIMGGLVLLAMNSGRVSNSKNAILCAAFIMVLFNPKVLRFDIGFQLSFLATIGIIYLSPYLEKFLKFLPKAFKIREVAIMSVAAQILTLPVIIYNFERISLVSPLVNILVVPFIPLTVMTGFISLSLGFLWYFLGRIASLVVLFLLKYELLVVNTFSHIPYASVEIEKIWVGWVVAYYIIVAFLIGHLKRKERLEIAN